MSGTHEGGLRARETNLADDPDFYRKIGAKGGQARVRKGFGTNPTLARIAGARGGRISRRTRRIDVTYNPVHPSEILKDIIEDREITQKNLADRLGISTKHMNELLKGQVSITPAMAIKLEFVLDTPAQTWLKLQSNYDMVRSRLLMEEQLEKQFKAEKTELANFKDCYANLHDGETKLAYNGQTDRGTHEYGVPPF